MISGHFCIPSLSLSHLIEMLRILLVIFLLLPTVWMIYTVTVIPTARDQYKVWACPRGYRNPCLNGLSKAGYTACFNGTTKYNVYCCNPSQLSNAPHVMPSKDQLFKPDVCCTADGMNWFFMLQNVFYLLFCRIFMFFWNPVLFWRLYPKRLEKRNKIGSLLQICETRSQRDPFQTMSPKSRNCVMFC